MDEQDIKKRLLDHVDPNRRNFVRQILGGAAFVAPLIATFSIDSLVAPEEARASNVCKVDEEGYAGPQVFQAHFSDPSHTTTASGVATFVIMANPPGSFSVQTAQVDYTLVLTGNTTFVKGKIYSNRDNEGEVAHFTDFPSGKIDASKLSSLCKFYEFLDGLDAEYSTLEVDVTVAGTPYTLTGTIKSKTAAVITLGP